MRRGEASRGIRLPIIFQPPSRLEAQVGRSGVVVGVYVPTLGREENNILIETHQPPPPRASLVSASRLGSSQVPCSYESGHGGDGYVRSVDGMR